MKYKVKKDPVYDVVIVSFSESINVNDEPVIFKLVNKLKDEGHKYVVFNLKDVEYIDSAGMGSFLSARSILNAKGGELVLVELSKKISGILELAGFYRFFKIYETEEEGVKNIKL